MSRITLSLQPLGKEFSLNGKVVEAELPLGRKPLLRWLFERDTTIKTQP